MRLQTFFMIVASTIATTVVAEDIICGGGADYANCIASAGCGCSCDPTTVEVTCIGGPDCESLMDCLANCQCNVCT